MTISSDESETEDGEIKDEAPSRPSSPKMEVDKAIASLAAPLQTMANQAVVATNAPAPTSANKVVDSAAASFNSPATSSSTAAKSAEAATNAPEPSSVSFKPSGPLEASEEAVETKKDQEMVEVESKEAKVESSHLEFKKSLDQSALQLLEDYQSSDDDERMSNINEEEIKSASDESESEEGEAKDEVINPKPKTSTPIDVVKALGKQKAQGSRAGSKKA
jgi:hypothetical protein